MTLMMATIMMWMLVSIAALSLLTPRLHHCAQPYITIHHRLTQQPGSDSDSDDEIGHEIGDVPECPRNDSVDDVMANATATRITQVTRTLYDSHLRQMTVWCLSTDRFRQCVGTDGKMVEPLNNDAMIMYTQHLINKQVPWPHHEVAGTMKHLAVKTVCNFFSACSFSFALRNESVPQAVGQFFVNTRKSYALKIARLKDAGLHPDRTNSIGVNFSVYETICNKLGTYVAHFKGSCYSSWRDLWLFWVFLFNLLGRCLQVSKIGFDMIWWQDDALVVKVPTQKGETDLCITHHLHHHTPPYTTIHHQFSTSTPIKPCYTSRYSYTPPFAIHRHSPQSR